MQLFSPFEYLCIDIANSFGLDKKLFEERIEWVLNNIHNLEAYSNDADDPALYIKGVLAMRKAQRGEPIGHLISLDSVCSGIQIMSAMTGCIKGASATGLVHPNKRSDAYTETTVKMNEILVNLGYDTFIVSRVLAKEAMMTAGYGSEATPKEIFGEYYPVFMQAALQVAQGAFELMPFLVKSWNPKAMDHSWVMPDGFHVYIPSINVETTRIRVDELDGAGVTFQYEVVAPLEYSKANAANLVHSVDALVLRNMVRRCSYNKSNVNNAVAILEIYVLRSVSGKPAPRSLGVLCDYVNYYEQSGWVDPVVVDLINEDNVTQLPIEYCTKLLRILRLMLENEPFDLITVHDA